MSIPPIYIMAAITIVLSAVLWGGVLYVLSGRDRRLLWLLLPGLPLSAVVNLAIKRPLILWLGETGNVEPGLGLGSPLWFIVALSFVPPVTEEAIKVLPLLLPAVRRRMDGRAGAMGVGLALGISFGLGEAAYLAWGVAHAPEYAAYPWYAFTGFLSERVTVTLVHGLLTMLVTVGLWRGGWHILAGYASAVLLHLLTNVGAILYQLEVIPVWAASFSLLAALLILALIFERWRRQAAREGDHEEQAEEVVYFERNRGKEQL
ncbi:MAG: hypothetical protein P8129_12070 [Anaerolineae bacterium]|jgi:hypothetical protein